METTTSAEGMRLQTTCMGIVFVCLCKIAFNATVNLNGDLGNPAKHKQTTVV